MESQKIPEGWRRSALVPIIIRRLIYKTVVTTIKIWEKVLDVRIRREVMINKQQYVIMPRKSTTDKMFALTALMDLCTREKRNESQ